MKVIPAITNVMTLQITSQNISISTVIFLANKIGIFRKFCQKLDNFIYFTIKMKISRFIRKKYCLTLNIFLGNRRGIVKKWSY